MSPLSNKEKLRLLDELFDQFLNSNYLTEEEAKSGEWDANIDDIVSKNLMLLRRLKTQSKAELRRQRYNRIKAFVHKLKTGLDDNIEEYRTFTNKIFNNPKYAGLQPLFSKLENVTEKDEMSMLLDAKILELLDEMEGDFDKEIDHEKD